VLAAKKAGALLKLQQQMYMMREDRRAISSAPDLLHDNEKINIYISIRILKADQSTILLHHNSIDSRLRLRFTHHLH
jgi:hypothetical protein